MTVFRSILVPVDLTPSSDRVLGRVSLLPLAPDARVQLLHVIPEGFEGPDLRRAKEDAHRALLEEARHLRTQVGKKVHVEPLVKTGSAAREIADQAAEIDAELIVMGRGGGRPLRDVFLGSTAERVVRAAKTPVLVVRLAARSAYARPSLAIAPDEAAKGAVRFMLRVLPSPLPRVQVIHAYDMPFQGFVYPSLSRLESEHRKETLRHEATRELLAILDDALEPADVVPAWKTYVRHGSARTVVERALAKGDSDLLVVGTHGHAGPAFALLGTVAGELLRSARCDVLVVPPVKARRGG